jgi:hypothetical protein
MSNPHRTEVKTTSTRPWWVTLLLVIAVVVGVAALAVAVTSWCGWLPDAGDEFWNGVGALGVAVSSLAVALALAIYMEQRRSSTDAAERHSELLREIGLDVKDIKELTTRSIDLNVPSDRIAEDEPDEHPEDTAIAEESPLVVTVEGVEGNVLEPQDVPIGVVGDLVRGWQLEHQDGKWKLGYLVGAFRPSGQGNHPWYLTFQKPDGDVRVWRVYRGGRGRTDPIVRDVTRQ